ncbi:MAG: cytochrome c maturation protein CcmE [Pseudomonadota bacterium]
MKTLKKQRRIQILVITAVAMLGSFVLFYFAFGAGINYFRSPSQVIAEPPPASEVFRIGGLVEDGSLIRGEGEEISFRVTDGGASVPVTYVGILPDLFSENEGMVGLGTYEAGVFRATEILARHDETYMPREVVDALKEQGVYKEPDS